MNRRQLERKRLERQRVNRQRGDIDSVYRDREERYEWEKRRNERMGMTADGKIDGKRIQVQKINNNKLEDQKESRMIFNILGIIVLIVILFGIYKLGYSVGEGMFGSIIQMSSK